MIKKQRRKIQQQIVLFIKYESNIKIIKISDDDK